MSVSGKVTTAFVLGAGLGTRLRPLTESWPKPLLPLWGRPMLTYAFERLRGAGVRRLIVNTHHRAERYESVFPRHQWGGLPITFRHEPVLLDTGGGIRNIADLVGGETILVHNGDIVTDLPLGPLIETHFGNGNEVTLALRSSGGPLCVELDGSGRVTDICGRLGAKAGPAHLFAGVYVVGPPFYERFRPGEIMSVIPVFLDMIRKGARLGAVVIDDGFWMDLGTVAAYEAMNAAPPLGEWHGE
ncbi:MAG TPA: nucleotidyltransferase family protein [Verrucomicrobiae bacterium]|nr:nucleotidyltransferase family protein [Verrucomicrobiae bacterium]